VRVCGCGESCECGVGVRVCGWVCVEVLVFRGVLVCVY
jgi:hypothetical protein